MQRQRGFTLLEVTLVVFLSALVFAGAFTLLDVCSDILAQVSSLVRFKDDAYVSRERLSREVREATLVEISGTLGQQVDIHHIDGHISRFLFSPGPDGSYDTIKDNQILYWRDVASGRDPEVLAMMVSQNGNTPFVTRVNPQQTITGGLATPDPSLVNNNLIVFSYRIGETSKFTFGGYGGSGIQGVEVNSTVLVRNATQNGDSASGGS